VSDEKLTMGHRFMILARSLVDWECEEVCTDECRASLGGMCARHIRLIASELLKAFNEGVESIKESD